MNESISNLTPADVYFGRGQTILLQKERIKRQTIAQPTCSTNGKPRNHPPSRGVRPAVEPKLAG